MLSIREKQMTALQEYAWHQFEMEMLAHSKTFSPVLCKLLGDQNVLVALRQAIARARKLGFTNRGPIRLYIELMFLCGSDFHNDPLYPRLTPVLLSDQEQMFRAHLIYQGMVDYHENVSGKDNINTRRSLEYLSEIAYSPINFDHDSFNQQIYNELHRAFPLKIEYSGKPGVMALIEQGRSLATRYQFESLRGQALMIILMFAFGHGCAKDPLYPWIGNTLEDQRIIGPEQRIKRLEKKSLTWLRYALGKNPSAGGNQT